MTHCHIGTNVDNRERDVKSIRELEDKAREAAKAKDLDRYVSFYADDAVLCSIRK